MTEVTKEFKFEMAHMLANHKGACKNLHGHSYKLFVTATPKYLDLVDGMVVDFSDLKTIVNDNIVSRMDHAFMYNTYNPSECEKELCAVLEKHEMKVYRFEGGRPTAENMAEHIFDVLNAVLYNGIEIRWKVSKVVLYETEGAFATYTEDNI